MDSVFDGLTSAAGIAFWIIDYVVLAVSLMVIAKKDGLDNGWFAWIPILNVILMMQIAAVDWWYFLLLLVPCVNIIVWVYIWWQICESRGRPGVLSLLMLVPIANFLLPPFLAFTD